MGMCLVESSVARIGMRALFRQEHLLTGGQSCVIKEMPCGTHASRALFDITMPTRLGNSGPVVTGCQGV